MTTECPLATFAGFPLSFRSVVSLVLVLSMAAIAPRAISAEEKAGPRKSLSSALPRIPPTSPAEAVSTFRLRDGFRMELLAAEPLLTDPVALKYDENGLAWVVEMSDYPYTDKSKDRAWAVQTSPPIGRVRVLEDTDGDGRFDKATTFADKLSWPTGLAFWKGGVYVTATPDIWYLKDTDGDHKADIRRKVFTGFRKFNVQSVMNNLRWGLDHRIYAAGSSNGGEIRSLGNPRSGVIRLRRSDFRFDPREERFELVSGGARFGNSFDDWGDRFLCNIRNPVQHVVLPRRYVARNPDLSVVSSLQDAAEAGDAVPVYRISPPEPWRVINARRLAADTSRKSPRSETHAVGFVTSSSGITVYRGAAYPREYYGNVFIGEVAGNLVMRYRLQPDGVTFKAVRSRQHIEFLASTDNWFRPVNFVNAPDGTLHLLDMYRETIEHPWSIPDDIKEHLDLTSGRDRGRIYRIVPPRYPAGFHKPPRPHLGTATTAQLVAELENPNSWWRETAHRLLFERQDAAAVPLLQRLLSDGRTPQARLHALWSLDGLKSLTENNLRTALSDRSSRVREQAVRLSESRLKTSPRLLKAVRALADDPEIRVRFQTALSLGTVPSPGTTAALVRIARRDGRDRWMRTAILSSLTGSAGSFLVDLLADAPFAAGPVARPMLLQLARTVGARHRPAEVNAVLTATAKLGSSGSPASENARSLQLDIVLGLGRGLKRTRDRLARYAERTSEPGGRLVSRLLAEAAKTATDAKASLSQRKRAVELLGYGRFESARLILDGLLDARDPLAVQSAAIESLAGFVHPDVAKLLLAKYSGLTPAIRQEAVLAMLSRSNRIVPLLEAVAARQVSIRAISPVRRSLLMKSGNADIRRRAVKLFAGQAPGPRREIIARYRKALAQPTDPARGKKVFKRICLACHRLDNEGHAVGPNLATVKNRTTSEILVHVLDPNREVSPNFLEYVVVTEDGRIKTGIIAAETATSITLRRAEGKQDTILRRDIETISSSGKSLMPEGLEKKITPREMADLLSFVSSLHSR